VKGKDQFRLSNSERSERLNWSLEVLKEGD